MKNAHEIREIVEKVKKSKLEHSLNLEKVNEIILKKAELGESFVFVKESEISFTFDEIIDIERLDYDVYVVRNKHTKEYGFVIKWNSVNNTKISDVKEYEIVSRIKYFDWSIKTNFIFWWNTVAWAVGSGTIAMGIILLALLVLGGIKG